MGSGMIVGEHHRKIGLNIGVIYEEHWGGLCGSPSKGLIWSET